jgi:hypothetical protein
VLFYKNYGIITVWDEIPFQVSLHPVFHVMTQPLIQCNAVGSTADTWLNDNQSIADRFELVRMTGKGFENHEEDSSMVDSPSDCPAVMELFRYFRDCE